jgi:hypothetical protein
MSASPVLSKDPSPSLENDVEQVDEIARSGSSPSEAETNIGTSVEPTPAPTSTPSSGNVNWQAIWSPAHSAYYFYNSTTQETTWVNPLQPPSATSGDGDATTTTTTTAPPPSAPTPASGSGSAPPTSTGGSDDPNAPQEGDPSSSSSASGATPVPASIAQIYALQEAAAAQGIDPSLAYLDPSLASGAPPVPGGSGTYNFTAKFNAHTGAFARPDGRDPTHLSEYERMKRMSSVYFNMEQWEQEVAQRKGQEEEDAANGKKRKRPTKKDLVGCLFFLFFALFSGPIRLMLIVIFAGALQRAKEVEKDRKDSLAAHVDSGGASRVFFYSSGQFILGAFSHTSFVAIFHPNPSLPQRRPDADIHTLPSSRTVANNPIEKLYIHGMRADCV